VRFFSQTHLVTLSRSRFFLFYSVSAEKFSENSRIKNNPKYADKNYSTILSKIILFDMYFKIYILPTYIGRPPEAGPGESGCRQCRALPEMPRRVRLRFRSPATRAGIDYMKLYETFKFFKKIKKLLFGRKVIGQFF
jgi:hypothetical protein